MSVVFVSPSFSAPEPHSTLVFLVGASYTSLMKLVVPLELISKNNV
jgi:hypothetical protein